MRSAGRSEKLILKGGQGGVRGGKGGDVSGLKGCARGVKVSVRCREYIYESALLLSLAVC